MVSRLPDEACSNGKWLRNVNKCGYSFAIRIGFRVVQLFNEVYVFLKPRL